MPYTGTSSQSSYRRSWPLYIGKNEQSVHFVFKDTSSKRLFAAHWIPYATGHFVDTTCKLDLYCLPYVVLKRNISPSCLWGDRTGLHYPMGGLNVRRENSILRTVKSPSKMHSRVLRHYANREFLIWLRGWIINESILQERRRSLLWISTGKLHRCVVSELVEGSDSILIELQNTFTQS